MPNWTEHNLHIVGGKADVDRFIRTGFTRRSSRQFDDLLEFRRLCPLKRGEPRDTYQPDNGDVLIHCRTRTQALFTMQTAWDYAPAFYARLARHWPTLSFACSVNGEMGDFGGVIVIRDGLSEDLVRDYETVYVRRTHQRQIARALRGWMATLTDGRDYRLMPDAPWEYGSMPFDAHFDGDFWFYFRTREEMAAFKRRYKCQWAMMRTAAGWKRVRLAAC